MPRVKPALSLTLVGLLAACAAAPDYAPPQVAAPVAFKEAGDWTAVPETPPAPGQWWTAFGDPDLDALEARIDAGNPDLATAVARYDQATAQLRRAGASLVPQITAGGDVERARVSAERPLAPNGAATYNNVSVGASLSYEIDLFGRLRSGVRAATADAQASEADVAATRLALQAQLAATYFNLRTFDARLVLLRDTVTAFQRAYDLTATRHEGGIASGLDVGRAGTQLATAKAELDGVAASRARAEHAIAILVGQPPADLSIPVVDRQVAPPAFPPGLPSTLLMRRPDVVSAERRVAAANQRIGVARGALFPQITLGATGGFESVNGDILKASNAFWALGPLSAVAAIFDGGARRANVRIARGQFDEAAAQYRSTVLTAFREVEDDLATARHLSEQERNQRDAVTMAERTRDLAYTRYRDGASDYLEVVTAQTAALDNQRALLQLRADRLRVATDLVRALGGGYSTP